MERLRPNNRHFWVLRQVEGGEHDGEHTFYGPFTEKDANTISQSIEGRTYQELPDLSQDNDFIMEEK